MSEKEKDQIEAAEESVKKAVKMEEEIFSDVSKLSSVKRAEEIKQETLKDIEERKSETTKTGRKSKKAKDAETEEVLIDMLQSVITGANALLVKSLGQEMNHEPEEIETLAVLGAPVANKYFDVDAFKYKEEAALLSYLFMAEVPKLEKVSKRLIKERKNKKKEKDA